MKRPTADYLHDRGWDYLGEKRVRGGNMAKMWKSRTGQILPQGRAAEFQRHEDWKGRPRRDVSMSVADWRAEGERLFGADPMGWKFVCPVCKYVASVKDWKDVGAGEEEVAFSCIGRHTRGRSAFSGQGPGPCNYAGGGLFRLNPVHVKDAAGDIHDVFAFAEVEGAEGFEPSATPLEMERSVR